MVKLLGAYFIIDGLAGAIGAFRVQSKDFHLMQVVVSLAVGLVLLFWTGVSAKLFLIVVGIWALLQGAGMYLSSRKLESEEEQSGLVGTIGAVMAVIGLVLIFWPNTGVVAISWLIALGSLLVGGLLVCPHCREMLSGINPTTNLGRCFRCEKNFNTIDFAMIANDCDCSVKCQ